MPPIPKKHLRFVAWPEEDRARWLAAFEPSDVFDDARSGAHLAAATQVGLRTAYARYLGFLASNDAEKLHLPLPVKVDQQSIKAFVEHLRQSCRDTSVASTLHHLRMALGLLSPERDWSWLKTIANRIASSARPKPSRSGEVTSAQLFALGIQLMTGAENSALVAGRISKEDALTFRDGLIIALLAAVPLRKRTLAALTVNRHLIKIGDDWLLDIPALDTKTRRAMEFPIPAVLSEPIDRYLNKFRAAITGADNHHGLWPSAKGHPMGGGAIYDAVRRRTMVGLGLSINLHRFRGAAGTLWSILDPANVRGVKDLLGHTDFGTTERHYIGARSRLAGRALSEALRSS
jgi:integrase/recombinase XerD